MAPGQQVAKLRAIRGRVQIDTARGLNRWRAADSKLSAPLPAVRVVREPFLERGQTSDLVQPQRAHAARFTFEGTTRRLASGATELGISPVVSVVMRRAVVRWLLFTKASAGSCSQRLEKEVLDHEEAVCPN